MDKIVDPREVEKLAQELESANPIGNDWIRDANREAGVRLRSLIHEAPATRETALREALRRMVEWSSQIVALRQLTDDRQEWLNALVRDVELAKAALAPSPAGESLCPECETWHIPGVCPEEQDKPLIGLDEPSPAKDDLREAFVAGAMWGGYLEKTNPSVNAAKLEAALRFPVAEQGEKP